MNQVIDPYRAPQSATADIADPLALETAGKGRRFGTFVVDYAGFFVLMMLVGVALALLGGLAWFEGMGDAGQTLFGLAVMISYYLFFEGLLGRTPGKFVFGTRVVDEKGGAPTFRQVLGRTFSRFIPFEAFSLLFSAEKLAWHDTLPKTRVVRTR
jgi:uncharacterized RDD family membrane protein YckC